MTIKESIAAALVLSAVQVRTPPYGRASKQAFVKVVAKVAK